MAEKRKIFVIMPFQDEFFETYETLKNEFSEKYEFSNAAEAGNQQNILQDIIEPIYNSDIIIADLTGLNPNVMYELGVAHTFNKKTIIITRDDLSELPFDLKQYRAKNYTTHYKDFVDLINYLEVNMEGAITGSVLYSNPVKDFMDLANLSNVQIKDWFADNPVELEDETEAGFLDFLAEIENGANSLEEEIQQMTAEMKGMSDGIERSIQRLENANKSSGNRTASAVRIEVKNVAKYISSFDEGLRKHNESISDLWNGIEKNTLGLLKNDFSAHENNRESLVNYLKSLKKLQAAIAKSNKSVEFLKNYLNENQGIEKSLTQAIRSCTSDLSTYISDKERISSSIDKILSKSKFVVGEISLDDNAGD